MLAKMFEWLNSCHFASFKRNVRLNELYFRLFLLENCIVSIVNDSMIEYIRGRIRHHGKLVAPAEALEPVNDHCFIISNCPFTAT